MKIIKHLLLILIVCSCKEKTFADDIMLKFPKNEKLTIQKFNEDGNEMGSNLIYFGKIDPIIDVKYFGNLIPEPPPPPKEFENKEEYNDRIQKIKDSIRNLKDSYFRTEEIPYLTTKENLVDSLSNKKLAIVVKEKDTIPLYKKDNQTNEIKKHKAFPVFIKNISGKTLKIPIELNSVLLYVKNKKDFQMIRNSNYTIFNCLELPEHPYFELKPNEILIFAFPHLQKGATRTAKFVFYNAESEEFDISIDENIISNQKDKRYLE